MPTGISCPQCGGGELRQITPGYYECLGQIIIGAPPPEATRASPPHAHRAAVRRPLPGRHPGRDPVVRVLRP